METKEKFFLILKNDKTNLRPISLSSCVQSIIKNDKHSHVMAATKESEISETQYIF